MKEVKQDHHKVTPQKTTETDNYQALKMYRHIGFKEDYAYPQSYLPIG